MNRFVNRYVYIPNFIYIGIGVMIYHVCITIQVKT